MRTSPDSWELLDTPALLVDLDKLEHNIDSMAKRAAKAGVTLRPHFKTHKSTAIARLQATAGATGFTVSKLDEAEVLLGAGFDNILVATQVVGSPKIERALDLARQGNLILAVDSMEGAKALAASAKAADLVFNVSIEIDSGLSRCGIPPSKAPTLARDLSRLERVRLVGVFTHGGHIYGAKDAEELRAISTQEVAAVVDADAGISAPRDGWSISVGSTPGVLCRSDFDGINEIRPGNYVFLDAIQVSLGLVSADECALTVSSVVMSRPADDRAVIDAGSKSLGLDKGVHGSLAIRDFGHILNTSGRLVRLSEEHGVVEIPKDSNLQVGDRVRILPNHACSVTNLHDRFYGLRGENVEAEMLIDASRGVH